MRVSYASKPFASSILRSRKSGVDSCFALERLHRERQCVIFAGSFESRRTPNRAVPQARFHNHDDDAYSGRMRQVMALPQVKRRPSLILPMTQAPWHVQPPA